ncbi:MAG: DSD1 family PLP-dependent enzyme [Gammaproteobacteria bacterium]
MSQTAYAQPLASPAGRVPPPAEPGMALGEVDTPSLVVELGAVERNVARMAEATREAGVRLRPHAKTHKCGAIALAQMSAGAVGVCCQKVSEAAAMAAAGVTDVLVSNQIVGQRKIERLADLARTTSVGVCVDDARNVAALGAAAQAAGVELEVLVEIDVGARRCGVLPGAPAVALAEAVSATEGLRFGGLQAYQGSAQHLRTPDERSAAIENAITATGETVAKLQAAGFECRTVAGAGTGTFDLEAASGVYNELQAGSYVFMDADYARNLDAGGSPITTFEHSLFMYATVMSTPSEERVIIDAGLKSMSVDSGLPIVSDWPGLEYVSASDEHGNLAVGADARRPALGEKLMLIPGHCDPTVNLYDWLVAVRDGRVEALWPVDARGAVY